MMALSEQLVNRIKVICPIDGVSVGRKDDRSTWRIDFRAEATDEQRGQAQALLQEVDLESLSIDYSPEVISDRQFFQQLAVLGIITKADALAAVKVGTLPPQLQAAIDALPKEMEDMKFDAEMKLSGAVEFHRSASTTIFLAQVLGWTDQQVDDLWRAAAALK